jgi:hypothetical protein
VRVASVARMRIWDGGTRKSLHIALKRRRALTTAVMVACGMGIASPEGECWAS